MNELNDELFEIEDEVTEVLSLLRIMDYTMIYCEENGIKYGPVSTLLNTIIKKTEELADRVVKIEK